MTLRTPKHHGFKASSRLIVTSVLSASMLMTTACGTQGFGVGRNPLGHGEKPANVVDSPKNAQLFDGNPDKLNALFLRSKAKNLLAPGQTLPLDVIALDRDGKRIDPSKLKLVFSSSKNQNVSIDAQGVLTGLIPFESSEIKVVDETSGASAVVDVTVGPREFTGNPEALASLNLVLRQQAVPGKGESAQFQVVAKDILGNPIDPARLRLEWTVSDPSAFEIDKNGEATALGSTGTSNVIVRDTVTGRVTTGTIRTIGTSDSPPVIPKGNSNTTGTTDPIPNGQPGVPAAPAGPSQGNGPIEPAPVNNGAPSKAARIMLTPAVSDVRPGDRVQLSVTLFDDQGRAIDPNSVPLQWVSSESTLPVDQTGTVTAQAENKTTRVTVSVPGTSLSASAIVNSLAYTNTGGGGGGGGSGGGGGLPQIVPAIPLIPSTFSRPLSTSSFNVTIIPPTDSPEPIKEFRVTVGNAPGAPTFTVPATGGTVTAPVPPGALLNPDTTYPYSVVSVGNNGKLSGTVNSFGTTLLNLQPTNLLGGSKDFAGVIKIPVNAPFPMNTTKGNALGTGDASPGETLTVTLKPTAANFGTVSLSGPAPGGVTVTGAGTSADPLVISGPKDLVNDALNLFVYTPTAAFVGDATVTMTTVDTVEGVVTPDDVDTLIFSVQAAAPAAPQNLMNLNPVFSGLTTTINAPITLNPLNNDELGVKDDNGDTLTVTLTPTNGSFSLVAVPSGVTITGTGTAASPMVLTGSPFYINSALRGGLTFTPTAAFTGTATIRMQTSAPDGSDDDTVNINVIQPSNLYNGNATFPATNVRMAKNTTTTFDGAGNKALSVLYPPGTVVKVNLVLLDSAGNNPSLPANGTLTMVGTNGQVTVTNPGGANGMQLVGPIAQVNALLAQGVIYSPVGGTTGNFKLRMNSVDNNNALLTDTNDILNLEVSAPPVNSYASDSANAAFPQLPSLGVGPLELAFNTPLTFATFSATDLSVDDPDSTNLTTTLTPDATGKLTLANTNPFPVGVSVNIGATAYSSTTNNTATNTTPMVISGPKSAINLFLSNIGVVFTPNNNYVGGSIVTMTTDDGGGSDTDKIYINVLGQPENLRNTNPTFTNTAILSAPGVLVDMSTPATRVLSVRNYPSSNPNVLVQLSVPAGKGTLDFASATPGVTIAAGATGTNTVTIKGKQADLNTHLAKLRYTPNAAAVGAPETVNITMNSNAGPLGDSGDLVPFLVTNPPQNSYNGSTVNGNFPTGGSPLQIFANQAMVFNNTATSTQPAATVNTTDDSTSVTTTLTPANTGGNTAAVLSLTGAAPGTVTVSGAGTNASPLVLSGPTADVQTALGLLQYTPQTGFTGATSFTIKTDDGGPSPDTDTVNLNVKVRPQNAFNASATFPGTNVLIYDFNGQANPIKDDTNNSAVNTSPQLKINQTVHPLSVLNLSAYNQVTDTATVRLQIPTGTLAVNTAAGTGVTISAGANNSGDLTISATGPANIATINTVLATLTWTPPTLNTGDPLAAPAVLTMTSGPIPDTDTLNLLSTRTPRNLLGGNPDFTATPQLQINEGVQMVFDGTVGKGALLTIGSQSAEAVEDSPAIRVKLIPSLISGTTSGTVSVTLSGAATKTGAGTNADPLIITGTPTDVNATLASLKFDSTPGADGAATIDVKTTDNAAEDTAGDAISLLVRAKPANRWRMNEVGNETNTFPGTGSPINVGLNTTFAMNQANSRQLGVKYYQNGDTIDVTLKLSVNNRGTLTASSSGGAAVTGSGTDQISIHSTGANSLTDVNAALATLVFNSVNSGGTVDLEMTSTNGTVSDSTVGQDVIRFNVQNQTPINFYAASQTNFPGVGANPVLFVVNDNDTIDFGVTDPTAGAATGLSLTGNTPGALTVTDDDSTVTTTVTPPSQGTLSLTGATPITPSGTGTNGDPFVFVGSPANINASLAKLRFTPNVGATVTNASLTINTVDGALQSDTDTVKITIEANTTPNPTGTIFRAVYQLGRDKLPQLTVTGVKLSGNQLAAGAKLQIIRYNDNDPTLPGDDSTTVLRDIILKTPQATAGIVDTVTFDNITNLATVVVKFPNDTNPLSRTLLDNLGNPTDGQGKIGARFIDSDTSPTVSSDTTPATYPFSFFVFPERTIYGVEYVGPANSIYSLVNTNTTPAGSGRLTSLFQSDSTATKNIQNGQNKNGNATVGLAKRPTDGHVFYINEASPGSLIEWNPALGIDPSSGSPFTTRGNLSITNGPNGFNTSPVVTTYRFDDRPARMGFNTTVNGGTKTDVLYAGSGFIHDDNGFGLSGFYRINNFTGSPTVQNIFLTVDGVLDETAFNNTGDFCFEPDTDNTATVADNRMFIAAGVKIYATKVPVPGTGTADVDVTQLTVPLASMQKGGANPRDLVGLSIDGSWTTGTRSILVVARYNAPSASDSRLYRIDYTIDGTGKPVLAGTATLLASGDFTGRPLVDITSAHLQ